MSDNYVTSPELETEGTLVKSGAHFSGTQTLDLSDAEIQEAWRIIQKVRFKYSEIFKRKFNEPSTIDLDTVWKFIDQFEDELKTRLADSLQLLATVNCLPVLEGKPIEIEYLGVLPGHSVNTYGMDHERKAWEVKKATERGESYLGESKG